MWTKIDDKLWGSPKWLRTPPGARALWVTAMSWCGDQLTDGHVPEIALPMLGGTRKDAAALVRVGLWETTEEGWVFHDWLDFQPSSDEVRAKLDAESDAGKLGNHRRWHLARGVTDPECPHCSNDQVSGTRSGTRIGGDIGCESGPGIGGESSVPSRPVPTTTELPNGSSPERSRPDRFDEFWDTYPRRAGKKAAGAAWRKAIRDEDPDVILDGARRFANDPNLPEDKKFIPHPATWLNQGRWDDEPLPPRQTTNGNSYSDRTRSVLERERARAIAADQHETHQLQLEAGGY